LNEATNIEETDFDRSRHNDEINLWLMIVKRQLVKARQHVAKLEKEHQELTGRRR